MTLRSAVHTEAAQNVALSSSTTLNSVVPVEVASTTEQISKTIHAKHVIKQPQTRSMHSPSHEQQEEITPKYSSLDAIEQEEIELPDLSPSLNTRIHLATTMKEPLTHKKCYSLFNSVKKENASISIHSYTTLLKTFTKFLSFKSIVTTRHPALDVYEYMWRNMKRDNLEPTMTIYYLISKVESLLNTPRYIHSLPFLPPQKNKK